MLAALRRKIVEQQGWSGQEEQQQRQKKDAEDSHPDEKSDHNKHFIASLDKRQIIWDKPKRSKNVRQKP